MSVLFCLCVCLALGMTARSSIYVATFMLTLQTSANYLNGIIDD